MAVNLKIAFHCLESKEIVDGYKRKHYGAGEIINMSFKENYSFYDSLERSLPLAKKHITFPEGSNDVKDYVITDIVASYGGHVEILTVGTPGFGRKWDKKMSVLEVIKYFEDYGKNNNYGEVKSYAVYLKKKSNI